MFAPHDFSVDCLSDQILANDQYIAVIAEDIATKKIVGYAVTQLWIFDYDVQRWSKYHLSIQNENRKYACFAPSVADEYHHIGIGSQLLQHSRASLKKKGFEFILLWGGVQCHNIAAVQYYLKHGFKLMGHFDYEGSNYDMGLMII